MCSGTTKYIARICLCHKYSICDFYFKREQDEFIALKCTPLSRCSFNNSTASFVFPRSLCYSLYTIYTSDEINRDGEYKWGV